MSDADRLVCNSCQFAIRTQDDRQTHYKSEWHRYNVKRRCAGLPPFSLPTFTEQLSTLQQRRDAAAQAGGGGVKVRVKCEVCGKVFASKASYDSHLLSKKHIKMTEQQGADADVVEEDEAAADEAGSEDWDMVEHKEDEVKDNTTPQLLEEKQAPPPAAIDSSLASATAQLSLSATPTSSAVDDEKGLSTESTEYDGYTLQAGESPIPLLSCLFCSQTFSTLSDSTSHMHRQHGFFIPFPSQLASVDGLVQYLGEKVGIGHCCVYCSARYGSTSAVRQHMREKSHCKVRLDSEEDEEEYADYYDFGVADKAGEGEARSGRRLVGMTDAGELLMTDGSTIGHRQYQRVYQQNVRVRDEQEDEPQAAIEAGAADETGTAVVATDMKGGALILHGGEKDSGRRYRESWVRKNERRLALKIGMRNNLQKHYVPQVQF